ncbi:MAG TPA: hypothetical protein VEK15_27655 [Vicinamibacteria bacterium]|nr:hypothetical protein [Vicinamibacteria bacterium]
MPHSIEAAPSGRAKCRGCGRPIARGDLRLGVRLPNPFDAENELTLWFHLLCGAYTRPDAFLEAATDTRQDLFEREKLESQARLGLEYPRLPRLRGVERARTGRSACRSCREAIPKDAWRIALTFYDEVEGRFSPGGFLHLHCGKEYFGTAEIVDRLTHFTPGLERAQVEEIASALRG